MDAFERHRDEMLKKNAPLADRMRPRTLEEFVGQEHIVGPGRLLRRAIQIDQLSSVILYGPPGTGKTTLARIIANTTKAQFLSMNAVLAGVKEIRDAIDTAQKTLSLYSRRTILFIDEVHRFNKAQQDALLPHVENGTIILIGATTENPYFEVNKALVSRSRIFQLKQLGEEDLKAVARQALSDPERGYGARNVAIDDDALEHLVRVAAGDARGVLNALELAVETTQPLADGTIRITRAVAEESIQQRAVLYDKDGDAHYDTISAFIKSVRGSDPDAALYWMAKMIYAGEDPRFIFRRMMILACEDVGMADPAALGVVVSAAQAFDYVGLPEGRYHLAHACLYLATAPKSNSSMAFFDALDAVSKEAADDVPLHLRDASRDDAGFGHGKGYLYPHAYRDHWVAQQYLPQALQGRLFYDPSRQGYEKNIRLEVMRRREAQIEAMAHTETSDALDGTERGAGQGGAGERWMKRTLGAAGGMLERVRDRIFELAPIRRDSLVLDLHGRSGLLAFEAARRAADGGVWVVAYDDKEEETLNTMGSRLDALRRPLVVRAVLETTVVKLREAAGKDVAFDVIIGRNIIFNRRDKREIVQEILELCGPGGTLVLAETVASAGQRLHELPAVSSMAEALRTAEEELFNDEKNPMVNWSPSTLEKQFAAIAGVSVHISESAHTSRRRMSPKEVDFWFRRAGAGEPKSLGDRLRGLVGSEGAEKVRAALHGRLDYKDVEWRTVVAYIVVRRC